MSSMARHAVVLVLSFSCAGFVSTIHGQTKPTQKLSLSNVSGRVTIHGKGARGIVVGIRTADYSPQPAVALKAITDQDGNYRITDIPPGNYRVSPIAPAYINSDPAVSRAMGKTLLLAADEDVQGIDFSLLRGGVITGKVRESSGRAIIEERLNLVTEDQAKAREMSSPVGFGRFQTDDRGVYRIYGIPPGRYKISVGIGDDRLPSSRFGRVAYKRTFYPAATDAANAGVIEVGEGAEVSNIDITVERSLPGFPVVGKVVDGETGQPVADLMVGLRRLINDGQEGVGVGVMTASNGRGEFRLENVPPGKYATYTASQPSSEVRTDRVTFEVVDQEVTGLLVKTVRGLTITGNVVLDGTFDKGILATLSQLRVNVYVRPEESNSGSGQQSGIGADGSFRLGGLSPGTAHFSLGSPDGTPASGFTILRVERDGAVQPRGLEIKAGEQVSDVKLIVSYGSGAIRGEVKLENGPLPQDGRVFVWIKKVGDTGSGFRQYNLDARGYFLIEGIVAGSYEINANVNLPGRPGRTAGKQAIQVSDGAITNVTLTVDLKSNPE
jgi:protocatechuate 3,4-dioxygenase beta subunit